MTPPAYHRPTRRTARQVRVALVTANDRRGDEEVLPWDKSEFAVRRGLGETIRRFAFRLKRWSPHSPQSCRRSSHL